MGECGGFGRAPKGDLMLLTACWWIYSLSTSLIISLCGTGLGSCSPLFTRVSQTDRLLLMKAQLEESVKDGKISIHGTHKGGKGKTVKRVKKLFFFWRPVISLSLEDMLMKLCSFSRLCHFQYFSSQRESAFHGICYIYLGENSIQHVFWLLFYAPFHGYKHMFEAATMILGSVTLLFFFLFLPFFFLLLDTSLDT